MKRISIFCLLFIFLSLNSWADVIYLKNGQKITGEIIQETGYSYKIKVGDVPYSYYENEVEKVVKGEENLNSPAPAGPQPITPEKAELIKRLLDANGSREGITNIFQQVVAKTPVEGRSVVQQYLKVDEVIQKLIPLYAQYFTEDELKEIVNFYRSPVGNKLVQVTPKIMDQTMKQLGQYFQGKTISGSQSSEKTNIKQNE